MRALLSAALVIPVAITAASCGGGGGANAGYVAYVSGKSGHPELYVVKPDGTGLKRLTNMDSVNGFVWAPDGRSLLFNGSGSGRGGAGVYTIRVDGGGLHRLVRGLAPVEWSPDLKRVLLVDAKGAVYVANADGTGRKRLADRTYFTGAWSPDGKSILLKKLGKNGSIIYVVDARTGSLRLLTKAASFVDSSTWSPDGKKVAFASDGNPDNNVLGGVETINADGTGLFQVTHDLEGQPVWSPDGTTLAVRALNGIDVTSAAGGRIAQLTTPPAPIQQMAWSPDANRLAYTVFNPHPKTTNPAYDKLYVVGADGSGTRLLADHMGYFSSFAWQPLTSGQLAAAGKLHAKLRPLPVTVDSWVTTFCTSVKRAETKLSGYAPAIQAFAAKLKKTKKIDLPAARDVLAGVFATGGNAFRTVEADMKAEGPPGTRNGVKLQAATLAFVGKVAGIFDTAAAGIKSLPTSSKKSFSKAGKAVIKSLETSVNGLQVDATRFSRLAGKQIEAAANFDPDCSGGFFGG